MRSITAILFALLVSACDTASSSSASAQESSVPEGMETAIFASGCFWCTEADFEKLDGVSEAISGYIGGEVDNPTYMQVVRGGTGHIEAVQVVFDPDQVSYDALLDHYWRNVDPFDGTGQFCDRGESYAPAIFTLNSDQASQANESRDEIAARFEDPIAVRIEPADTFWTAEDYHQDYAEKNPVRYSRYRFGCRRDQRLREVWGDEAGGVY